MGDSGNQSGGVAEFFQGKISGGGGLLSLF